MTEETVTKSTTLTRQELYAAVWETPMSRLGMKYGISGNGLAKICDRLSVPYPPRGYWAKKAAGKSTVVSKLSEAESDVPREVTITPTFQAVKPSLPAEIEEKIESLSSAAGGVRVNDTLTKPHPIIAGWLKNRAERKQEARRERDLWRKKHLDPGELSQTDHRKHRILDALFKNLEAAKAKIKNGEQGKLLVIVDKEEIEIQLREKLKQIKRQLTADEMRFSFYRDRGWTQELQPNGILSFSIKTYLSARLRSEWTEGSKKTMEEFLPEILGTLLAAGPLLAEHRRKREEREKQRQLDEQRRYEEKRRRDRDDNRWRRFVDFADSRSEIKRAQVFLEELKAANHPDGTIDGMTIQEWIVWAEDALHARDSIARGSEYIFGTIAAVNEWNYRD